MTPEGLISAIRDTWPEVSAIYLFGSSARGTARPDSDLDLAVLAAQRLDATARWDLQERLADLAGRPVDLVDLRAASTVMRVQVIDGAAVLFDADPSAREAFEAIALSAYARLQEERRGILEDIARTGHVYG